MSHEVNHQVTVFPIVPQTCASEGALPFSMDSSSNAEPHQPIPSSWRPPLADMRQQSDTTGNRFDIACIQLALTLHLKSTIGIEISH